MLELAEVGPGDVVYDLGPGDGRIPITAAREFGARGVGIDIDPQRIRESKANAAGAGVTERVRFRNEDLLEAEFRDATVVTLFLSFRAQPQAAGAAPVAAAAPGRPGGQLLARHGRLDPAAHRPAPEANIYLWRVPAAAAPAAPE